jgi:hypothetical protein
MHRGQVATHLCRIRRKTVNHNLLIDIVGWIGAAGLLAAYGLVSTRKTEGDSVLYQALNLAGSGLLMINSFYYGAYPSSGVNIVWVAIAVYALSRKICSHSSRTMV